MSCLLVVITNTEGVRSLYCGPIATPKDSIQSINFYVSGKLKEFRDRLWKNSCKSVSNGSVGAKFVE